MSQQDDFFTAKDIDEQIEALASREHPTEEVLPAPERLIAQLHQSYQNQQRKPDHLERAWQRILAQHQATNESVSLKGNITVMQTDKRKEYPSQSSKKRPLLRVLGTLAAVLCVVLLIGGMVIALNVHQQKNVVAQPKKAQLGSGGTPLPTPAHPIVGGACTIDTTHPHPQESQKNQPGLYIFAQNQQSDNLLYRYDPQSKTVIWSIKLCQAFGANAPLAQNGILYFSGTDSTDENTTGSVSYIYALNQRDGTPIWGIQFPNKLVPLPQDSPNYGSSPLDLGLIEAPTLANNVLYVIQRTGIASAYDARTGARLWSFDSGSYAWATTSQGNGSILDPSSIQVVNHIAYFSIVDRLFALDAQSGKRLWMHDFNKALNINQSPTLDAHTIYVTAFVPGYGSVATPDTYIYAFDAKTGAQKWVSPKLTGYLNAPLAYNGQLSVTSYDGVWYALNSTNGAVTSQSTLTAKGYGVPVLINAVLYALSQEGAGNTLSVLNADGSTKWSAPIEGEYPLLDDVQNGIIYISGRGSGIYAYSATDGSPLWNYPGQDPQPEGILLATIVS